MLGRIPESRRVAALRQELAAELEDDLDTTRRSLGDLIRRHLVRVRRQVAPAKRNVIFVRRFWDGERVMRHLDQVFALARLIEEGADLSPYLSARAHKRGKHPRDEQHDGDFALAAYDVHHLHFDALDLSKPRQVRMKDKEDALLFATFGRDSAVLIMVGTHKSFHDGTLEAAVVQARADSGHLVLNGVLGGGQISAAQRTKLGLRGVNAAASINGRTVLSSMVMGNGSSMRTLRMADFAASRIQEIDPILDDVERSRTILGSSVPDAPEFEWHFDHTQLLLYEATTRTSFTFSDQSF